VQPAVLNQTWLEVDERLLRLHLEASCSSIAAEFCRMKVATPVQLSPKHHGPFFRWIADAKLSFEAMSGKLRHSISFLRPVQWEAITLWLRR
jgi:hypothetical protein